MLLEYSKGKDENQMVENILINFMAIVGLSMLAHATYRIVSDPISFFNFETFNDFYLPPLLSILFFPYVFAMTVYVKYENAFVGLKFKIEDDAVRAFAKRRAVLSFRADTNTLKRWSVHIFRGRITSRDDVLSTIQEIQNLQFREANPEDIPFEQGWSPYRAKEFLSDVGLPTDYYRKAVEGMDEWWATSSYLDLDGGLFPNRIAYYVNGSERVAISLKLALDVNDPEDIANALEKFREVAGQLFKNAFEQECPKNIEASIQSGQEKEVVFRTKIVKIVRENWVIEKGYTIKFIVRNENVSSWDSE